MPRKGRSRSWRSARRTSPVADRHRLQGAHVTDTLDASQIDLLDRDRFTQGIPHEWFTWLRNNAPVHFHEEPDGPGFWVITKHADVIACNRDAGTFSSDSSRGGVVGLEEREISEMEQAQAGGKLMLFMDPPDHTRYRKLVNRGLHAADDRPDGGAHPRAHQRHPRQDAAEGRVRLRGRHRGRAAARGDRRAHRRAPRGPPQDLRVVQPDDRLRGPRVRGVRRGGVQRPGRDVHVRPAARRGAPPEAERRHHHRAR